MSLFTKTCVKILDAVLFYMLFLIKRKHLISSWFLTLWTLHPQWNLKSVIQNLLDAGVSMDDIIRKLNG